MHPLIALALALAASPADGREAPPAATTGARATAMATVEILHAETSSPDPGERGLHRQVRRRGDGQAAVEFE